MKVLLTGACGFVGSTIARSLFESCEGVELIAFDNLSRSGSEVHRTDLARLGVRCIHGDVRCASDFDSLSEVDWLIDAAANPSVMAGVDGRATSRQVVEHNLCGTINMLESCKKSGATFTLLSTSRVYSIRPLADLQVEIDRGRFAPVSDQTFPAGVSVKGISELCSTNPPVSLYGSTKLASETLALEYGETFGFPVWINRCGVMAGAGQFGRPDQGIFSYWIHSHLRRRRLRYLGFDGSGAQVRDAVHPRDVVPLLLQQFDAAASGQPRVCNLGGGLENSMSLAELTEWCDSRFGSHPVEESTENRLFDLPWVVMDCRLAKTVWGWEPTTGIYALAEEIARHAEAHDNWLEISAGGVM
jgi:CDP-paratose 2-epimerase